MYIVWKNLESSHSRSEWSRVNQSIIETYVPLLFEHACHMNDSIYLFIHTCIAHKIIYIDYALRLRLNVRRKCRTIERVPHHRVLGCPQPNTSFQSPTRMNEYNESSWSESGNVTKQQISGARYVPRKLGEFRQVNSMPKTFTSMMQCAMNKGDRKKLRGRNAKRDRTVPTLEEVPPGKYRQISHIHPGPANCQEKQTNLRREASYR